jgi:haloalkane dehalogenase
MPTDLELFRAASVQTVDAGTPLTYRRFGAGPAIVFVHGWPLNGATYRGLVRRLSRNFTCYVPDLPGSGGTPWDPATQNLFSDWAVKIVRLADTLKLERLALIGHDSGGAIARFAAAELGDRVSLLGLSNTEVPGHLPRLVLAYRAMAGYRLMRPVLDLALRSRAFRTSSFGLGRCFADHAHLEGEFHQACVAPVLADSTNALRALRAFQPHWLDRELPALHARLRMPTVFAWGEDDPFFPVAHARAMLADLPDVRAFETLRGQSLFVHDEAPDLVADVFEPWLLALHAGKSDARASA